MNKPFIVEQHYFYNWSWKLVSRKLFEVLSQYYNIYSIDNKHYLPDKIIKPYHPAIYPDLYFLQNITLLRNIEKALLKEEFLRKVIVRCGGNKSFHQGGMDMNRISYIKLVGGVIATNKFLYDISKQLNPNTVLIPNGIDLNEWNYIGPNLNEFTVGFAGNISTPYYRDYKGYDFVLKATKKIGCKFLTALFGDRQIPHDRMKDDFYSKLTCFVLPTKGEGSSNVITEALALGIPILTTKEAGFHGEMLTDRKNVLFIERDAGDIFLKLKELKNDRELLMRLSRRGREFAEKYHDINKIAKQYRDFFNRVIKENQK